MRTRRSRRLSVDQSSAQCDQGQYHGSRIQPDGPSGTPVTPMNALQLAACSSSSEPSSPSTSPNETSTEAIPGCSKRKRGRGPTFMRDVWEQLGEEPIPVSFNSFGQPNDKNTASIFANFMGTVARNGKLAPLHFLSWRKMPNSYKQNMVKIVKSKFEIPEGDDHFILKSLSKKWRDWKSNVKKLYFDPTKSVAEHLCKVPDRLDKEQWKELVIYWSSEKGMDVSVRNRNIRNRQLMNHRMGTRSFAVVKEMEQEKLGHEPSRVDMFMTCYAKPDGTPVNEFAGEAIVAVPLKEKEFWTVDHVETFCKLCLEQIDKGHCPGTRFSEDVWRHISDKFQDLTGKKYDSAQVKSKWDDLKEDWQKWKELISGEIDLGWDSQKNTIDASEEWWKQKIQMNPGFRRFKTKGIPPDFQALLDRMFMNIVNGYGAWTRSQDSPSNFNNDFAPVDSSDGINSNEDLVDRDIGKIIAELSLKRGKKVMLNKDGRLSASNLNNGDFAPVDSSDGMNTIDNTAEKDNAQSIAELRMKKVTLNKVGRLKAKKKKKKVAAKLREQLNKIYSAVESKSINVSQPPEAVDTTYCELIEMLGEMPEIEQNDKLHFFALDHLKERLNQVIFKNLKSHEKRVNWLKHEFKKQNHR